MYLPRTQASMNWSTNPMHWLPNKHKDLLKYYLGILSIKKNDAKFCGWDVNLLCRRKKVHVNSTFLFLQYCKSKDLDLKARNNPLINLRGGESVTQQEC